MPRTLRRPQQRFPHFLPWKGRWVGILLLGLLGTLWVPAELGAYGAPPATAIIFGTNEPPFQPSVRRAVLLAGLLPGGGAFYLRQPLKGMLLAGVELAPLGLSLHHYRLYRTTHSREELQTAFGWLILFVGTKLFAMADSYVTAKLWDFKQAIHQVEQDVQVPEP